MSCSLCGCDSAIIRETFQVEELRTLWVKSFSFDPFDGFEYEKITKKQCANCDLIYYDPAFYGDGAFYEKLCVYPWYYENDKWEFDVAARLVAELKPASFLEVGCGSGCFLEKVVTVANCVEGLDINRDAVRQCDDKGLVAIVGTVKDLKKSYDMIASFEVLEHMDDLSNTIKKMVSHLNPSGTLILAVPNPDGYLKDMGINLLDMPPHHNSSWSKQTFDYLASEFDLEISSYEQEPLRYVHYIGYVSSLLSEHRNLMLPSMKKRLFSFIQTACINVFSPFMYIQQRDNIIGQTHLVVLKKRP